MEYAALNEWYTLDLRGYLLNTRLNDKVETEGSKARNTFVRLETKRKFSKLKISKDVLHHK